MTAEATTGTRRAAREAERVGAPTPPVQPPLLPRPRWAWLTASVVAAVVVQLVHGVVPWLIGSATTWYNAVGEIRCGELSLSLLLQDRCAVVGGDAGSSIGNGQPIVLAAAVLGRATGMPAGWAYSVVVLGMALVAVVLGSALLRRFGASPVIALVGITLFLISPTVLGFRGLGSTQFGVLLLPASIEIQLRLARECTVRSWWRPVVGVVAWIAACFLIARLDGYGFLMSQAATGVLLAGGLLLGGRRLAAVRGLAGFAVANGVALLAYRAQGGGDWAESSIDLFRAMGADVVTLLRPTVTTWWTAVVPSAAGDWSELWGDGSNSAHNYLSVATVVLAVVGTVVAVRRDRRSLVWLVVLAAALVLALGPSLKVGEVRGPLVPPITYESYLMPESRGLLTLPTQWVYENVPGFSSMRATYRWVVLARLALVVLAAAGVTHLLRQHGWRRVAGVVLAVLAVVDTLPALPRVLVSSRGQAQEVGQFDAEVVAPLDDATRDGARVVFYPNAVGGNDYLAGYLATGAHLQTYNAGGDKTLAEARESWPDEVTGVLRAPDDEDPLPAVATLLESGAADCVVVPFFDLRWSIGKWPDDGDLGDPGTAFASRASADERLDVRRYDDFAVVGLVGTPGCRAG